MTEIQEELCSHSEYITAIIGVCGTLLGTIVGWLLNSLSRKGKLNIYISNWIDKFSRHDNYGGTEPCTSIEPVEYYSYSLCLDIYNSSSESRIMRNIAVVFSDGNRDIYTETPADDSTRHSIASVPFYDEVTPLTIQPKSVYTLNLHGGSQKKDGVPLFIWSVKKVFLNYTDEKNKQKKVLLKEEDYSKYFENHMQEGL